MDGLIPAAWVSVCTLQQQELPASILPQVKTVPIAATLPPPPPYLGLQAAPLLPRALDVPPELSSPPSKSRSHVDQWFGQKGTYTRLEIHKLIPVL